MDTIARTTRQNGLTYPVPHLQHWNGIERRDNVRKPHSQKLESFRSSKKSTVNIMNTFGDSNKKKNELGICQGSEREDDGNYTLQLVIRRRTGGSKSW